MDEGYVWRELARAVDWLNSLSGIVVLGHPVVSTNGDMMCTVQLACVYVKCHRHRVLLSTWISTEACSRAATLTSRRTTPPGCVPQEPTVTNKVFFDIEIDGKPAGRITMGALYVFDVGGAPIRGGGGS